MSPEGSPPKTSKAAEKTKESKDKTPRSRASNSKSLSETEIQEMLEREHAARVQAEALSRRLAALQQVTDAALANFTMTELLLELMKRIREVLTVDTAAILLLEKEANELVAWAALGLEEEVERGVRIPYGQGFAGKIIAEMRPLIVPDLEKDEVLNPLLREKGISSLLGVPLVMEGRPIGVIHVGTFRRTDFTPEDIHILQLAADRIALSIERTRANETEQAARAAAEEANLVKDEFLTILSHELRTPLTPIMGWSQMMQAGLVPAQEFGPALEVINRNSKTLKRLIDDLLDMSAILSGKMRIEQAPVSLEKVLHDAVQTVSTAAREAGIKLVEASRGEHILIQGDSSRLVQAFCNILHNAIKFTSRGGVVEISTSRNSRQVVVSISDSGAGIEEDFLPHVFERFRQADGSPTRMHGGLGLGLALVKSFVEAHGGTVSVSSKGKNQGAVFSVSLPVAENSRKPETDLAEGFAPADETARARILIVEDQQDTLEMLSTTVSGAGFDVVACASATEALLLAENGGFDLVISDIGMPGMDGFELIRTLRTHPLLRDVPAIAVTGYASENDAAAALRAGFNIHMAKPIDPTELAVMVENLLRSNDQNVVS
jgi:signal transduction histidine kinase/ActR/RegA family two-component response regulator